MWNFRTALNFPFPDSLESVPQPPPPAPEPRFVCMLIHGFICTLVKFLEVSGINLPVSYLQLHRLVLICPPGECQQLFVSSSSNNDTGGGISSGSSLLTVTLTGKRTLRSQCACMGGPLKDDFRAQSLLTLAIYLFTELLYFFLLKLIFQHSQPCEMLKILTKCL